MWPALDPFIFYLSIVTGGRIAFVSVSECKAAKRLSMLGAHEVAMAFDASMRRTSKVLFNAVLLRAHAHNTFATSALEMLPETASP